MEPKDQPSSDRPASTDNDAEREVQIDEIIERIDRLEAEAARLRRLAEGLKPGPRPT